ncbi:MAG: hypothetical protein EAY76_00750 [Alphaproteobacteria bacterium]|nr:MAG: hypothetical protein EAY76_00750 [Alphaproteobacteria bacterium]TAF40563.1 MAG: hypothetical protein EAZ66_02845 [Alphaproteobacteria bacterium]TAF76046.1 MAG: hypothetical protein EAZ52_04950 [Alphaproteobacteria bacterium]
MRFIPFLFLLGMCISLSHTAIATDTVRPTLITERFFGLRHSNLYGYGNEEHGTITWDKLLSSMGVAKPLPQPAKHYDDGYGYGYGYSYNYNRCNYHHAITILEGIRKELGAEHPYQKIWATNQMKTFSACDMHGSLFSPPVMPKEPSLPSRAKSDYFYQKASWYFYHGNYTNAKLFYDKVIAIDDAPMRPYASYMSLRCLRELDQEREAYDHIDTLLRDPTIRPAHALINNYRFIMGWEHSGPDPEKHLKWLLSMIEVTPEKATDFHQSVKDYDDAMYQLNAYFPYYDKESKTVDWWLSDVPLDSKRMLAVRTLAKENETVDWMQAKWAYNVFEDDWLWSLHQPNNPYWQQNQHIVHHAWKHWHNGDGLEWLHIALSRVHPNDALAEDILNAAIPYLHREWTQETHEYQAWLLELWTHATRLYLGRNEHTKAIGFISEHGDFRKLALAFHQGSNQNAYNVVLHRTLRWLVYTNHIDEARAILPHNTAQYCDGFDHWRTLLAPTTEALIDANKKCHSSDSHAQTLWHKIVNNFSTNVLYNLARDPLFDEKERTLMSRAALTRAMLLHVANDDLDRYATLAAELNPTFRERILRVTAHHSHDDYIEFLLRHPRFRPVVNLDYIAPALIFRQQDEMNAVNTDLTKIDTVHHSDNNWWCRVDGEQQQHRVYDQGVIVAGINSPPFHHTYYNYPYGAFFSKNEDDPTEFEPYIQQQKAFINQHPYHQLIDASELKALEALPSGPEYLTNAAMKQAQNDWFGGWWRSEQSEIIAANLFYAIRTTRYGCQRNGSHADYSRKAFDLLHDKYGDTIWAKATPYWFGCAHFRHECRKTKSHTHYAP